MRLFEDFAVGDVYRSEIGRTVTEADNLLCTTLTHNTNELHFNEVAAAGTEWGRVLVKSGLRALAARWTGDVHAAVKSGNAASRVVFEKLAFETRAAPEGQLLFVLSADHLKARFGS